MSGSWNRPAAAAALVSWLGDGAAFGQAWIATEPPLWRLSHRVDRSLPDAALTAVRHDDLRELGRFAGNGTYRPLRSTPNLARGWYCRVKSPSELMDALQALYPGAVPDWWAARNPPVPITPLETFFGRQTGVYRSLRRLPTELAIREVATGCAPSFCVRHRLWTVDGRAESQPDTKSAIPCLEPCGVLLDFARRAVANPSPANAPGQGWDALRAELAGLPSPPSGGA